MKIKYKIEPSPAYPNMVRLYRKRWYGWHWLDSFFSVGQAKIAADNDANEKRKMPILWEGEIETK